MVVGCGRWAFAAVEDTMRNVVCSGPSRAVLTGGPGRDRAEHDGTGDRFVNVERGARVATWRFEARPAAEVPR